MSIEELKKKYNIRVDELEEFTRIQVIEDGSNALYQDLVEYLQNCKEDVRIANGVMGAATKEEFLQGEQKIQEIIKEIQPDWTKKQKAAYVHYKMGEWVSYMPDFNFNGKYANADSTNDARNIWKSLLNEQSVCNGIVSIARNLLARVDVNTKEVTSGTHAYMLAEVEEGNILADTTWDLKNSLYGARPMYFGKTYQQFQEIDGELSEAHKLETIPENIIEIPDAELREIYHSLGYTNEDRTFIYPILDKFVEVNSKEYESMEDRLTAFFTMFTEQFPKEATHLAETRTILEQCMYEFGIQPENVITKFVYAQEDTDCEKPYLSLFLHTEQAKKQIRLLNTEKMQFENIDIPEFDHQYKTHNLDTAEPFWKRELTKNERENETIER